MGLTKDSLREGRTSGALSGLLYAYDLIDESRKRLAHMRGEVLFPVGKQSFLKDKTHTKVEVCE